MIKHTISLFSCLLLTFSACAQPSNQLQKEEEAPYQYERVIKKDYVNPYQATIYFTFTNGKEQHAISYRQEKRFSHIKWEIVENGIVEEENIIDKITANLAPYEKVEWTLQFRSKESDKEFIVEKAALLIMNEAFEVSKIIFDEEKR